MHRLRWRWLQCASRVEGGGEVKRACDRCCNAAVWKTDAAGEAWDAGSVSDIAGSPSVIDAPPPCSMSSKPSPKSARAPANTGWDRSHYRSHDRVQCYQCRHQSHWAGRLQSRCCCNVGFRLSEGVGAAAVDPRGCENSASSSSSTPTAVSKAPRPAIRAGPVVRGALQGRRSRYMHWEKRNNNAKCALIARLLPATHVLPRIVFFPAPSS